MIRLARILAAAAALAACHPAPVRPAAPAPARDLDVDPHAPIAPAHAPKLVVLLVIDQWPEWAFEQKRAALIAEPAGGFARLLGEGTWHVGEHPSAATLTAPGHALLGTGEPTARSGILANEWYHRELDRRLHAVEDEHGAINASWLRVPGLGDAIARAHAGAVAVAVALKDRAAVLPLGHAGLAIWYDAHAGAWASTAPTPPAWLAAHAAAHPVAPRVGTVWTPLDARTGALAGIPDAQPGETGGEGFGPTFPHDPATTRDPQRALQGAPLGDTIVLEAAEAAIAGEHLGTHPAADLLIVSLSAHDYVGHGWGQESWEMWDLERRLDRELAALLATLDRTVGADRWAMIVTSDHGATHLPELVGHGGRMTFESLKDAANRAAVGELGPGDWIADTKYPTVFFTRAFYQQPEKDRAIAIKKVMFALRSFPGIAKVARTRDYAGDCERRTGDARVFCLAIDPEREGELVYFLADTWMVHEAVDPTAASHGSHHAYDRRVPLLVLPPGRTRHAPATAPLPEPVPMTRVSSLLADWLGVTAPLALPRE